MIRQTLCWRISSECLAVAVVRLFCSVFVWMRELFRLFSFNSISVDDQYDRVITKYFRIQPWPYFIHRGLHWNIYDYLIYFSAGLCHTFSLSFATTLCYTSMWTRDVPITVFQKSIRYQYFFPKYRRYRYDTIWYRYLALNYSVMWHMTISRLKINSVSGTSVKYNQELGLASLGT